MALLRRAPREPDVVFRGIHMQVFLALRDAQRRVACVQLRNHPGQWMMPSENVFDGQDPNEVVTDVARRWFQTPLGTPRVAQLLNWPPEDDDHWMMVAVYEVPAPRHLEPTPDTTALDYFPPGRAPGPMFKDHAAVWARLEP